MKLPIAGCRSLIGVALTVVLALAATGEIVRAETIDRVLAVVANQLITLSDVTAATDLGLFH